jgi:hypothetical protein
VSDDISQPTIPDFLFSASRSKLGLVKHLLVHSGTVHGIALRQACLEHAGTSCNMQQRCSPFGEDGFVPHGVPGVVKIHESADGLIALSADVKPLITRRVACLPCFKFIAVRGRRWSSFPLGIRDNLSHILLRGNTALIKLATSRSPQLHLRKLPAPQFHAG